GKLWNLVLVLFTGYLTYAYTRMSMTAVNAQLTKKDVHLKALKIGLFAALISLVFIALSKPVVTALYFWGSISSAQLGTLGGLLSYYLIGAAPFIAGMIYVRAFSVMGRHDLLAYVALVNMLLNAGLDAILIKVLGVNGIGLASSISYVVTLFLFIIFFTKVNANTR
ncbi:MAG: polysaccharide biosynthesis C-terminal domain-containing protein, partial [Gammaproteobacteria bacterium]|nr:polysaccharide biosynthesis C-terminal domain-containing protein [Gammaproteobacteria bacterium]